MSMKKVIEVKDKYAPIEAEQLNVDGKTLIDDEDYPSVDKSGETVAQQARDENYAGSKYKPDIDGPQQDSQETDEIYEDPRDTANLPPAGKNVGELTVDTLGREDLDGNSKDI